MTLPPQPEKKPARPKYKAIQRERGEFSHLYIDHLIGADHPARLIWKIVAGLDLSAFENEVASFEQEVGRSRWSPQLLTSILTYGYTLGTGSARELERLCPASTTFPRVLPHGDMLPECRCRWLRCLIGSWKIALDAEGIGHLCWCYPSGG